MFLKTFLCFHDRYPYRDRYPKVCNQTETARCAKIDVDRSFTDRCIKQCHQPCKEVTYEVQVTAQGQKEGKTGGADAGKFLALDDVTRPLLLSLLDTCERMGDTVECSFVHSFLKAKSEDDYYDDEGKAPENSNDTEVVEVSRKHFSLTIMFASEKHTILQHMRKFTFIEVRRIMGSCTK